MSEKTYVVYGGSYGELVDAEADFDAVKNFHERHVIGAYEAAVFTKEEDGKVKIVNTRTPRRSHGAEWGAATGAVIGVAFPITFLLGAPVVAGAAGGALVANMSKWFGRKDIHKMGEALDAGASGVVVMAELEDVLPPEELLSRALTAEMHEISDKKAVHDYLKSEAE